MKTKVLDQATNYFNQPRRGVWTISKDFGGVFFYLAGQQFVLVIDLETGVELFVCVIKNGFWERI